MKAFQRFNPEAPVPQFPKLGAAKPAKPAKPQGFRDFQPPKAHLKLAKAGGTLGDFSQGLAGGKPQEPAALAALGTLAGVSSEKSRITRAVLVEVPDGVPEDWVQGVGDLMVMLPHPDWTEDGWKTLREDALRFIQEWAGQARRLGWEVADLFGVHPTKPRARFDCMGLVPLLKGRPVLAITDDSAAIRSVSGGTLTFRGGGAVAVARCLVWELRDGD